MSIEHSNTPFEKKLKSTFEDFSVPADARVWKGIQQAQPFVRKKGGLFWKIGVAVAVLLLIGLTPMLWLSTNKVNEAGLTWQTIGNEQSESFLAQRKKIVEAQRDEEMVEQLPEPIQQAQANEQTKGNAITAIKHWNEEPLVKNTNKVNTVNQLTRREHVSIDLDRLERIIAYKDEMLDLSLASKEEAAVANQRFDFNDNRHLVRGFGASSTDELSNFWKQINYVNKRKHSGSKFVLKMGVFSNEVSSKRIDYRVSSVIEQSDRVEKAVYEASYERFNNAVTFAAVDISVGANNAVYGASYDDLQETAYSVESSGELVEFVAPFTMGVALSTPVTKHLVLEGGINYTQQQGFRSSETPSGEQLNTHKLKFVSLPVNLRWLVNPERKFEWYFESGVAYERGIGGVYKTSDLSNGVVQSSRKADILFNSSNVQISTALGGNYALTDEMQLFIQPKLNYYIGREWLVLDQRRDTRIWPLIEMGIRTKL